MTPLTLPPPWAVLIADGRRSSEGRSRRSSYRGSVGPHVGSSTEYLEDVLAPRERCVSTDGLMAAGVTELFALGYAPGDRSPGRVRLTVGERPDGTATHRHLGAIKASGRHRRDILVKMTDQVAPDSLGSYA